MRQQLIRRLRGERGFTTVVVMMMLLVGGLLVAGAFAASDGDTSVARKDQYYKQAYAAAEAGVNYYLSHLAQNTNYWSNCYTSPIQSPGTAFSTGTSTAIPGSEGRYEIELLKAPGYAGACSATVTNSVIDPSTGQLAIRSTGIYRGVRRSIIATFKRQGFLNYLWFTDFETPDPLTYSDPTTAQSKCAMYVRDGRDLSYCNDQSFITGDGVNGPTHTNDEFLMCGTPSFGRTNNGNVDKIEASDPSGWRSSCAGSSPSFNGVTSWGAANLQLPTSNSAIKSYANANWIFTGPVHITLSGSSATVKNAAGTTLRTGTPNNGVIYVQNGTCSTSFAQSQQYPSGGGCGDAWVASSSQVTSDLTVAAENDVIIAGNITHNASSVVGLIANGFVRVYHPVQYSNGSCDKNSANITPTSGEGNGIPYLSSPTIQAAVLALNHSFWVDNYGCGSALGTLNVTGAIAMKFRGTVGTHSGGVGVTGYLKGYNYDSALKYHQPPYFLDPVQASWDLWTSTEQVPAH
jgi:Tfp pilus assembly protein PilX